jgi:hypothetical protein
LPQSPQHPPPASQPQGPPPGAWGGPPQPPRKNDASLIVVIAVAAVIAIVGGLVLLTGDDDDEPTATSAGNTPDCVHPDPDGSCPSPSDGDAPSDEGPSPEEQAYIDALAEVNESTSQGVLSADEARCISAGVVDSIGLDAMQATTPDEILANPDSDLSSLGISADQTQTDELAESINGCVDTTQLFVETFEQQGVPGDVVDCVEQRLDADAAAGYLAASYAGAPEVRDATNTAMDELLSSCEAGG